MALLKKRERIEIKRIPVRLPADVLDLLDRYATYLNRDRGEVLAAAVRYAVQLDEEFCQAEGITPGARPRSRHAADGGGAQNQSVV